jgi:hypothetical protein
MRKRKKNTQTQSSFVQENHLENLILGDKNVETSTRRKLESTSEHVNLSSLSKMGPKCFVEASIDKH